MVGQASMSALAGPAAGFIIGGPGGETGPAGQGVPDGRHVFQETLCQGLTPVEIQELLVLARRLLASLEGDLGTVDLPVDLEGTLRRFNVEEAGDEAGVDRARQVQEQIEFGKFCLEAMEERLEPPGGWEWAGQAYAQAVAAPAATPAPAAPVVPPTPTRVPPTPAVLAPTATRVPPTPTPQRDPWQGEWTGTFTGTTRFVSTGSLFNCGTRQVSGPANVRIDGTLAAGYQVSWSLPKWAFNGSCDLVDSSVGLLERLRPDGNTLFVRSTRLVQGFEFSLTRVSDTVLRGNATYKFGSSDSYGSTTFETVVVLDLRR